MDGKLAERGELVAFEEITDHLSCRMVEYQTVSPVGGGVAGEQNDRFVESAITQRQWFDPWIYQLDDEATLTEAEIEALTAKVVGAVEKQGGRLRA